MREKEFGEKFISYLHEIGIETWQEVYINGRVIDAIGKIGNKYLAFELKMALDDAVLMQAYKNLSYVNYSYIVIPYKRHISYVKSFFISQKKLGLILFHEYRNSYWNNKFFNLDVMYGFNEKIKPEDTNFCLVEKHLFPDQKESVAGSTSGNCITPFKRSCNLIMDFLKNNETKKTRKEVWNNLHKQLHWSNYNSFCSSLRNLWDVKQIIEINKYLK